MYVSVFSRKRGKERQASPQIDYYIVEDYYSLIPILYYIASLYGVSIIHGEKSISGMIYKLCFMQKWY
jgi:hypothetical protein